MNTASQFFSRYRAILGYGISLALLCVLLQFLEWQFVVISHLLDIYIGAIAIIFTCLGIWLALRLSKPKVETVIVEKQVFIQPPSLPADHCVPPDERSIEKTGLSKRELEVLELMAAGLSNQEIAAHLFVSLNTVKTHSSKIFEKLDVKRRTQAVDKARRLHILAKT